MDRNVLKNISYGMFAVGARDDKKGGCVVNTVFQITSKPTTIAVSINHDNYTNKLIKKTNKFSISILKEDTDPKIIGTFGYKSSKDIDKFKDVDFKEKDNLPYLSDSCGVLLCKVVSTCETSTHTIFIAEITDMFDFTQDTPMTYKYYQEVLKGKSPKNAPTYTEESNDEKKNIWKCSVCGFEVEMDELPEDFVCPICGAPIKVFKKIKK